ncbi:MAG: hypothetical protein ACRDLA_00400 [Thermoleophilaceae bacterium]
MKTTLVIPDPLFRDLKKRAVERGETMSNLVAEFIRRGLNEKPRPLKLSPLPKKHMGKPLVDITKRDELDRVLNAERDMRLHGRRDES